MCGNHEQAINVFFSVLAYYTRTTHGKSRGRGTPLEIKWMVWYSSEILWAWLDIFFIPKRYQYPSSTIIIHHLLSYFWALHPLRRHKSSHCGPFEAEHPTLRCIQTAFFLKRYKESTPVLFIWEFPWGVNHYFIKGDSFLTLYCPRSLPLMSKIIWH